MYNIKQGKLQHRRVAIAIAISKHSVEVGKPNMDVLFIVQKHGNDDMVIDGEEVRVAKNNQNFATRLKTTCDNYL